MERKYLSAAETAKLIRKQLKANFPETKFWVTSETYSGGASIDIHWIDGPSSKAVDRIVKGYEGADFDGMIDLKEYKTSWLNPDGSAILAHYEGTQDSHGSHPDAHNPAPSHDAIEVHFGADFIFTHRHYSPEFAKPIVKAVCDEFGKPEPKYYESNTYFSRSTKSPIVCLDWDCMDSAWGDLYHHIGQEIHKRLDGETPEPETTEEPTHQAEPVKTEEPKAEEPQQITVTYDREWTWIKVPAENDKAAAPALQALGARFSHRRLAWFITEPIDAQVILAALQPQPEPAQAPEAQPEKPSRFNLLDD